MICSDVLDDDCDEEADRRGLLKGDEVGVAMVAALEQVRPLLCSCLLDYQCRCGYRQAVSGLHMSWCWAGG